MKDYYSEISQLDEEKQIKLFFKLGRALTRKSMIQGSDERRMFEEFIKRTGFEDID